MYEGRRARTPFSFVVAGRGSPGIVADELDMPAPVDNAWLSTGSPSRGCSSRPPATDGRRSRPVWGSARLPVAVRGRRDGFRLEDVDVTRGPLDRAAALQLVVQAVVPAERFPT
jgi:hypothetical protein